jgi:hypothetical protein
LVALVIALTVLMFDRALCQSDWFYQGALWTAGSNVQSGEEARQSTWRFMRIAMRLALSFGLAWVIAMFLELAIFSGTISDKIERDRVAANQPIYQKITQYESQLDADLVRRRNAIAALETSMRERLAETPAPDVAALSRSDDIEQQIRSLADRETELRGELRSINESVQRYTAEMNAEELGQKLSPTNSGRPGAGPRYEFAKRQKEAFEAQRNARTAEIAQLQAKRDEWRGAQASIAAQARVARDTEQVAIQAKRDALQAQIDAARAELKQQEASLPERVEAFRRQQLSQSYFQQKTDKVDPLTRMAAYQELKNDPKDGATIALFSWMTRFFIIFLEIVPVVAKIFFSPPSVYAAKIQAEVERERNRVETDVPPVEPQRAPEPARADRRERHDDLDRRDDRRDSRRDDGRSGGRKARPARSETAEPEDSASPILSLDVARRDRARSAPELPLGDPLGRPSARAAEAETASLGVHERPEPPPLITRAQPSFTLREPANSDLLPLNYSLRYELVPRL